MKVNLPSYLRRNVKAMPTRTVTSHGVGTIRDRSVRDIVQKQSMSPREFWGYVGNLPRVV